MASLASAALTTVSLLLALWAIGRLVHRLVIAPLGQVLARLRRPGLWLGYLLLLPGTVLHETSHALACLVTGTRIYRFVPFNPQADGTLGWVEHDRVGPIRSAVISLAPLIGGGIVLIGLARTIAPGSVDAGDWIDPARTIWALSDRIGIVLSSLELARPRTWLAIYAVLSIGRAAAPSLPDLRHVVGVGVVFAGWTFLASLAARVFGTDLGPLAVVDPVIRLVADLNSMLVEIVAVVFAVGIALLPIGLVARLIGRSQPTLVRPRRRSGVRSAERGIV